MFDVDLRIPENTFTRIVNIDFGEIVQICCQGYRFEGLQHFTKTNEIQDKELNLHVISSIFAIKKHYNFERISSNLTEMKPKECLAVFNLKRVFSHFSVLTS